MESRATLILGPLDQPLDHVGLGAEEVIIGRAPDCALILADTKVSRHHARVERRGAAYFLVDLGSANGVRVNGQRISEDRRLAPGDMIRIGGQTLHFLVDIDEVVQTAPPAMAADADSTMRLSGSAFARPPEPVASSPDSDQTARQARPDFAESLPAGAAATAQPASVPLGAVNGDSAGLPELPANTPAFPPAVGIRPGPRSLAPLVLRLGVGLYFFYEAIAKSLQGYLGGGDKLYAFIVKQEAKHMPVVGYRSLVGNLIMPHPHLFSVLVIFGELTVGVLLIAGLLTRLGALGGLFLNLNYLLLKGGPNSTSILDLVFIGLEIAILVLAARQAFSLDGRLHRHGQDRWLPPLLRLRAER